MITHSDDAWRIAEQFSGVLASDTRTLAYMIDDLVNAKLERAASVARNACLVPPDGGNPTDEEAAVCDEAARRIREMMHTRERD